MNKMILIALLTGVPAHALTCESDQECLAEGLKLIKQANKLKACDPEVQAAANSVESVATPSEPLRALELCVAEAKKASKLQKKFLKRQERIKKAVGAR